jgi:hypothetical protein
MNRGLAPTWAQARTGLLTPPGIRADAWEYRALDFSSAMTVPFFASRVKRLAN